MSSRLHHIGGLDVKLRTISKESLGVKISYLHNSLVLTLCALEHLVIACVAVTGKMANIGDVHNSLNVQTCETEILFKNVLHNVASQVAYVRIVINCRAAGVHGNLAWGVGDKFFLFMVQ